MTRPALCAWTSPTGVECVGWANASGYCPAHDPAARERRARACPRVVVRHVRTRAEAARIREHRRKA